MDKGVMTGCNAEQEWMLKWWWKHYSKHNNYPVTFCDFGMSTSARIWCQEIGTLHTFDPSTIKLSRNPKAGWNDTTSRSAWEKRAFWFAKTFVLPESPYEATVWTDLDCEIVGSIAPLFTLTQEGDRFAIAHDSKENILQAKKNKTMQEKSAQLQAGVFAFKKDSPVIPAWIDYCLKHLSTENSDQTALSHMQAATPFDITTISNKYNWLAPEHPSPHAVIYHYNGAKRKRELLAKMELHG